MIKPKTGRRAHLVGMGFWFVNGVVSAVLVHKPWILYLLEISIYANFVGHWSGWSAERPTEVTDASGGEKT
jgi:hypothetical protein